MSRLFRYKHCPCPLEGHESDDESTLPISSNRKTACSPSALPRLAPLNWIHLAVLICAISLIKLAVRFEMHRFPSVPDPTTFGIAPESINIDLLDTDQFVTARARNSLNAMSSFGTRPAGSMAAERITVDWLVQHLENLKKEQSLDSHSKLRFTVDQVSGFFNLGHPITSVYSNITNILARLDPVSGDQNNALLMNCHFDSIFEAIGASDDAVNCAIMLEILRALMSSPRPLNHSVIFLFNGAEENILQATHGFLVGTSKDGGNIDGAGHPWAKQIRAFINLEAAGSGGREILFQTGPGAATPILVRAYASSAPYPFASVVAQEVFQAGLIPSDTDFRIFRDYGHLPGVDFAFYSNGFVYHSRYDTPERIPNGTIQRAGSNWLAIVRELASSDLSKMPRVDNPNDHSFEKLVYFDIFSLFLIVFPFKTVGLSLNILAIVGTLGRIGWRFYRSGLNYACILLVELFANLLAIALAAGFSFALATLMAATPSAMFWFARPWLLFPMYALPSVGVAILVHLLFFKFAIVPLCATADFAQKCKVAYEISLDAALFICSIAMAIFSAYSLATSYIAFLWVGPPLLLATLIPITLKVFNNFPSLLIFRHALLTIIPTVYFLYITDILIEIFVPITGREELEINPEYFIVALVLLILVFLLIFHMPAVYLCGGSALPVVGAIGFMTVLTICLVTLTPFVRPFFLEIGRADGVHVQRSATQLTLQKNHAGLWFIPSDNNGIEPLKRVSNRFLDNFFKNSRTPCLSKDDILNNSFCNLPNIYPIAHFTTHGTYWVDVDASNETMNNFTWPSTVLQNYRNRRDGHFLVQFRINCGETPHCAVYVSPHNGVHLLKWHFDNDEIPVDKFPIDKLRPVPGAITYSPLPTWFAMLRFGSPSSERKGLRYLFLTMEILSAREIDLFDFKVAGQYFTGSSSATSHPKELKVFIENLPDWHFTVPVTTLYSASSF